MISETLLIGGILFYFAREDSSSLSVAAKDAWGFVALCFVLGFASWMGWHSWWIGGLALAVIFLVCLIMEVLGYWGRADSLAALGLGLYSPVFALFSVLLAAAGHYFLNRWKKTNGAFLPMLLFGFLSVQAARWLLLPS